MQRVPVIMKVAGGEEDAADVTMLDSAGGAGRGAPPVSGGVVDSQDLADPTALLGFGRTVGGVDDPPTVSRSLQLRRRMRLSTSSMSHFCRKVTRPERVHVRAMGSNTDRARRPHPLIAELHGRLEQYGDGAA